MSYYPYNSPYGTPNRSQYGVPTYNGYNYIQPQQPQMPTMQQSVVPPQMQYDNPIQDIRFVTTEEAKAFIVAPNSTVLLIDKASGVAQLKSADAMGQSASKHYRFEEVNADGTPIKRNESEPKVDFSEFVKASELKTLGFVTVEQFKELSRSVEDLRRNYQMRQKGEQQK